MKKRVVTLLLLVLIVPFLSGCLGNSEPVTEDALSLTGKVVAGNGNPLGGVQVTLIKRIDSKLTTAANSKAEQVTTTSADGKYLFNGLLPGVYELVVGEEKYNPVKITHRLEKSKDLVIDISSFMGILRFSDDPRFNNYQFTAYVYPYGEEIDQVQIISPNGERRELGHNVHYGEERYSIWWNDSQVEGGVWNLHIYYSNGNKVIHTFFIESEKVPMRPEPLSPSNWEKIKAPAELEYTIPTGIDKMYIRLYEVEERDTSTSSNAKTIQDTLKIIPANLTGNFSIPQEYLEKGKDYAWQVEAALGRDTPQRYNSLSDYHYFSVSTN